MLLCAAAQADEGWETRIKAADFVRADIRNASLLPRIAQAGNLSGRANPNNDYNDKSFVPIQGWVEYEFAVPRSGWFQVLLDGNAGANQYLIDDEVRLTSPAGSLAGNVWLDTGKHRLRVERKHWTGFGPVKEFVIREVTDESLGHTLRYDLRGAPTVLAKGSELGFDVHAGGRKNAAKLSVRLLRKEGGGVVSETRLSLDASAAPVVIKASLPLPEAGIFDLAFFEGDEPISPDQLKGFEVLVVDTTPIPASLAEADRTLVEEIDCVQREPDFTNGGATRIVKRSFGEYRESGDVGYLQNMNAHAPSWFSYKLKLPDLEGPYLVEVDYPNDEPRTMLAQIRQGPPEIGGNDVFPYTTGVGVDTGNEFLLSNQNEKFSVLVWPTGRDWRITLMTPQTGLRAAASKIRLYKVTGALPPTPGLTPNGRPFAQWYEEGLSYLTVFGGTQNSTKDILRGTDNWLKSTAYMGANLIFPTVAIYQMAMYPSQFNSDFNQPNTFDLVRLMLLLSQKYGINLVAEFAPEAREVAWLASNEPGDKPNLLRNKNGRFAENPLVNYSPIHPTNREWYLNMIREFVERYKDAPNFKGVSLRVMGWANPGFINFHSLEWGYDDFTIKQFEKDTGISIPVEADDAKRFGKRSVWLMNNKKAEWIAWRCAVVEEIYRQVVEIVRSVRSDFTVYTDVYSAHVDKTDRAGLREMGVDIDLLGKIDGLEVINALHPYGRRDTSHNNQTLRDNLVDVGRLRSLLTEGKNANFFFTQAYMEATSVVTPNEQLGYPKDAPHGWMSGIANPAAAQVNERWALALAESDAQMLGDGGNAYTLGQPLTRAFLQEYRQLPKIPFTARLDARDPVAVWEARDGENFWFYAVNREAYAVPIEILLENATQVVQARDGSAVDPQSVSLTLEPYEVRVWRASKDARIATIRVRPPSDQSELVTAQVTWISDLAKRADDDSLGIPLLKSERELISQAAQKASVALQNGLLRTARSFLENAGLLEIFEKIGKYPPKLRHSGSQKVPEDAILAPKLFESIQNLPAQPSPPITVEFAGIEKWEVIRGKSGEVVIPFNAPVDGDYQLTVGLVGDGNAVEIQTGDSSGFWDFTPPSDTLSSFLIPVPIILAAGTQKLTVRAKKGGRPAISYLKVKPIRREIPASAWSVLGPFEIPGSSNSDEKVRQILSLMAEPISAAEAEFQSPENAARWKTPDDPGSYVDFAALSGTSLGSIHYARLFLKSPTARVVRLFFSFDYWGKIWLNRDLVQDVKSQPGGAPVPFLFHKDIALREGANELLFKVASGSAGNGFYAAITNSGDIQISSQLP